MARLVKTVSGPNGTAKIYKDTEWSEYQVRFAGGTYHTTDRDDALTTAEHMVAPVAAPTCDTDGPGGACSAPGAHALGACKAVQK